MKRISPISKKCENTLREILRVYPGESICLINNKILDVLSSDLKGNYDNLLLISIFNSIHAQLNMLSSIENVINEINDCSVPSVASLKAIMSAAGYGISQDGKTVSVIKNSD